MSESIDIDEVCKNVASLTLELMFLDDIQTRNGGNVNMRRVFNHASNALKVMTGFSPRIPPLSKQEVAAFSIMRYQAKLMIEGRYPGYLNAKRMVKTDGADFGGNISKVLQWLKEMKSNGFDKLKTERKLLEINSSEEAKQVFELMKDPVPAY